MLKPYTSAAYKVASQKDEYCQGSNPEWFDVKTTPFSAITRSRNATLAMVSSLSHVDKGAPNLPIANIENLLLLSGTSLQG